LATLTTRIGGKPWDREIIPCDCGKSATIDSANLSFSAIKAQVSCRLLSNTVRSTASRWRRRSRWFVTTDFPVCVHRASDGINYGQQFAPGFGLADSDILFSLSPKVALVGRFDGEEDVVDSGLHGVASFNSTIMGYAIKQIYAPNDQYHYTRPVPQPLGKGSTLLQDPNLKVRED
jgi:hypothetical protein